MSVVGNTNMNKIYFIILIISSVCFNSCGIMKHELYQLPNNLSDYKGLMLQEIGGDSMHDLGIYILPIIKKKNDVGIYAYSRATPHRYYYLVFMYNGMNVSFSDISKENDLLLFLEENLFSRKEIKSLPKKIKKIEKYNRKVYQNLIW